MHDNIKADAKAARTDIRNRLNRVSAAVVAQADMV